VSRTLADMRQAIVRNLGGSMTTEYDVSMPNLLLTSVINECLQTIDAEADWPWNTVVGSIVTANGTNLYTPTAGWVRTIALVDPSYGPLEYVSINYLAQAWPDTTETGAFPFWYTEAGGQLDLRPTPSSVETLAHTYYGTEVELIDDGDEPLLPDRFRKRLIDMATAEVAARNKDWATQQRYQTLDPGHERRMKDEKRRVTATTGVRSRTGTWDH